MAKKSKSPQNPGMTLVHSFATMFVVNSAVILAANAFFPQIVVLGTVHIPKVWAIFHSMGTFTLIGTFALPFIRQCEQKRGKMYTNRDWMLTYFAINFVSLWLIARFAHQLGLGLSSWFVALLLAIILDVVQGVAMMKLESLRTNKSA